jgi:hypothetical protein
LRLKEDLDIIVKLKGRKIFLRVLKEKYRMRLMRHKLSLLVFFVGLFLLGHATVVHSKSGNAPPEVLSNQRLTNHFHIYTDLDSNSLDYYEQFFEGFVDYFEEYYFKIRQKRPLVIYLFKDESSYKPYAETARGSYTKYGFYLGLKKNIIVVNRASGLGTATHELVHYFVDVGFLEHPPAWIDEGIATFFEKFIGHLDDDGKLNISFGYFSNWRFPITKKRINKLSMERIIKSEDPDQCAARSLMLFLHKKHLFANCVKKWRIARKDPTGVMVLEKIYGQSIAQIEQDWKTWVRSQPIDENVKLVPWAFVMPQKEWDRWLNANKDKLYWNEEENIYKISK